MYLTNITPKAATCRQVDIYLVPRAEGGPRGTLLKGPNSTTIWNEHEMTVVLALPHKVPSDRNYSSFIWFVYWMLA